MMRSQKIIKGLAILLASFLIFLIVSLIFNFTFFLLRETGNFNKNDHNLDNLVTLSDGDEISSLKIDLKNVDLNIKSGSKFSVFTNSSNVKYINNSSNIIIKEKKLSDFFPRSSRKVVVIYLPSSLKEMRNISIDLGFGDVYISDFNVKNLYLSLGFGNVNIDNLNISNKTVIDSGIGDVYIKSSKLNNFSLDVGIGQVKVNSLISGNNKFDIGIGNLNLNLLSRQIDYKIDVNGGIGNVSFNNKSAPLDVVIGHGDNHIEVDSGIGSIFIKTKG